MRCSWGLETSPICSRCDWMGISDLCCFMGISRSAGPEKETGGKRKGKLVRGTGCFLDQNLNS